MNSEDLSLKLTIDINILKFWIHLQNLPDDIIAKQCLQLSKDMAEKNQPGISQKIKTLCDEYSSRSMILNENNGKTFITFISSVAQNLSKALINDQLLILASNRKLNFYNTSKTDTNRTEFLDAIKYPHHRSAVNKFRLGNHRLRIETGRYTVPETPEHLRICSLCHANEVENECHVGYVFLQSLYDTLRNKFFEKIIKRNFFNDLDVNSKKLFLFNYIDSFICKIRCSFYFCDYELYSLLCNFQSDLTN